MFLWSISDDVVAHLLPVLFVDSTTAGGEDDTASVVVVITGVEDFSFKLFSHSLGLSSVSGSDGVIFTTFHMPNEETVSVTNIPRTMILLWLISIAGFGFGHRFLYYADTMGKASESESVETCSA